MAKENEEGLFVNISDKELKFLYEQILVARETGIYPSCFDEYIEEVQKSYPFSLGEAWMYIEDLFWLEIGKRYFTSYRGANDETV